MTFGGHIKLDQIRNKFRSSCLYPSFFLSAMNYLTLVIQVCYSVKYHKKEVKEISRYFKFLFFQSFGQKSEL